MNERKYNNQTLTGYLLGSLPETETERFDELCFTDEEFAAALHAAENDLIDSYVQGELAGAPLEKFNSHYLASPLRREKVNFAKALQVFAENKIAKPIESSVAEESKTKRRFAGFFSALNVFAFPNPALRWSFAAAAAVAFIFLGAWLVNNRLSQNEGEQAKQNAPVQRELEIKNEPVTKSSANSESENEIARANEENKSLPRNSENEQAVKKERAPEQVTAEQTRAPKPPPPKLPKISIAAFILAPPLRGGNQIPTLSVPKRTGDVALQLQLESDDYPAYRVALANEDGKILWSSGTLKTKSTGENKSLNLRFPANLLKSQIYSLTVSGTNAKGEAEIISNYPFRSVLK